MRRINHPRLVIYLFFGLLFFLAGCNLESTPSPEIPPDQAIPPTATLFEQGTTATATDTVKPINPSPTASNTPTITATSTPEPTPTETPFPSELQDASGAWMVLVPAGEFLMGSKGLSGIEEPIHQVYLDSFYIDKFEVTFEQYARFLNEEGNQFEGLANWIEANDPDLHVHEIEGVWQVDPGFENFPMNEMTWYGARAYCAWRDARLPTEAEWEKAARGTDGRLYPWGDEADCSKANFKGCNTGAVPVDAYPEGVSPYGAFNMAGNIMEWVNDWFDETYYANSPYENPPGPENGTHRVFRGGAFINGAHHIRTTYRWPKLPVLTYVATGFRCARDAGNIER